MPGGPSGLKTAATALGLALAIVSGYSLVQTISTWSPHRGDESTLRFASASPLTKRTATPVSLGPLELEDAPIARNVRKMGTHPAQLTAQIELDDLPPPPETTDDKHTESLTPPAAELLNLEPMPSATSATDEVKSPPVTDRFDRQEQQLARIAFGIELLARQAAQSAMERVAAEAAPVRTEMFVAETDRNATAVIKIERTAEDRDRFSFSVHAAPASDVFRTLCDLAGLKLEMSPAVTERITLTVRDVTLGEAINAVLQQSNLGVEREERLLRVMPRAVAEQRALRQEPLITRIYRPQVVRLADVLPLIRPILTPRIGRLTIMPDPAVPLYDETVSTLVELPSEILVIVDRAAVHTEVEKQLKALDDLP